MPDYGFGRCDGHHEMLDFRLRKGPRFFFRAPLDNLKDLALAAFVGATIGYKKPRTCRGFQGVESMKQVQGIKVP